MINISSNNFSHDLKKVNVLEEMKTKIYNLEQIIK